MNSGLFAGAPSAASIAPPVAFAQSVAQTSTTRAVERQVVVIDDDKSPRPAP